MNICIIAIVIIILISIMYYSSYNKKIKKNKEKIQNKLNNTIPPKPINKWKYIEELNKIDVYYKNIDKINKK
ncbi:hypothetical protein RJV68_02600 [Buchnera aphidicola (Neophyllaphis varicolor)]|uniref:hypothetical protein n=1 Tax=Buchnera aphidicola TaxID=9 RepID=UPI0031B83826